MSWVGLWKFLHISCMFGAVALFVGGGILNARVQKSGDVRAIRTVMTAENRTAPFAGAMMVLGLIFGLVTAIAAGFDLLAPWLLIAYALVLGIILTGALYHGPQGTRLERAASESPDDEPSNELAGLIQGSPASRWVNVLDTLLWVGLVFVMVVKPFGV